MDGCVDGIALCKTTNGGVAAVDIGEIAATMEECFHISLLASRCLGLFHVVVYLRKGGEIAVDKLLSFVPVDAQSLCQTKHRDAIDDAEVGAFGLGSFITRYVFHVLTVDFGSGGGMNVIAVFKSLNHVFVATEMGHDTQFYLTIIGREEQTTVFGDETLAYFLPILAPYGDVLQVRIARRKPSRGRDRLVERGVNVPCSGVDELG